MPRHRSARLRVRWLLPGVLGGALTVAIAPALSLPAAVEQLRPAGAVRGAVGTAPPSGADASRAELGRVRPLDAADARFSAFRPAPPVDSLTGYFWPIAKGRITLPFKAIPGGSRIKDGKPWHDGVDVASHCGDRVLAAHSGYVLAGGRKFDDWMGWVGDLGPYYKLLDAHRLWDDLPNVVVIDDGNGYRSIYAHFSEVRVRVGDRVEAGQLIGLEGMTGHASGCHVHYGLFSPYETSTFGVRPDIIRTLRVPKLEIARIDPLRVLPFGDEALRRRRIPPAEGFAMPPANPAVRSETPARIL